MGAPRRYGDQVCGSTKIGLSFNSILIDSSSWTDSRIGSEGDLTARGPFRWFADADRFPSSRVLFRRSPFRSATSDSVVSGNSADIVMTSDTSARLPTHSPQPTSANR